MVVLGLMSAWNDVFRPVWYRFPDDAHTWYNLTYMPGVSEMESTLLARIDWLWWLSTEGGLSAGTLWIAVAYMAAIWAGQRLMRGRKPFDLRRPLVAWNVALSAFSGLAVLRILPEHLALVREHGFTDRALYESVCVARYSHGAVSVWCILFALSKIVELGDTAFLMLRKKPVIFLHYIHHVITMCYTGYSSLHVQGYSRWFANMNLTVHTLMYGYFAVKALHYRVPRWVSMSITLLQLMQMFVGTWVCWVTLGYIAEGSYCETKRGAVLACLSMYLLYVVLFGQFFIRAYLRPRPPKRAARTSPSRATASKAPELGRVAEEAGAKAAADEAGSVVQRLASSRGGDQLGSAADKKRQ